MANMSGPGKDILLRASQMRFATAQRTPQFTEPPEIPGSMSTERVAFHVGALGD